MTSVGRGFRLHGARPGTGECRRLRAAGGEARLTDWIVIAAATGILAVGGSTLSAAPLMPAACFGAHMVLQRDMPAAVWGTATGGSAVEVAIGSVRGEAQADVSGRWCVVLPPQPASATPQTLVIRSADVTVEYEDVLVGDVWLCAGQSNMAFPLGQAAHAQRELADADRRMLRLLRYDPLAAGDPGPYSDAVVAALEPTGFCRGAWRVSTRESAAGFSAVGYSFARRLLDACDVPIGVVSVAVGGTPTEAWVRRESLAGDPATTSIVAGDWLANPLLDGWGTRRARDNLGVVPGRGATIRGDAHGPNHPFKPGFMWEAGIAPLVPLAIRGVAWYQGESNADSSARAIQHERLFPVLVADWRRAWSRPDMPFGVVQLPGMERPDWPAFRDGQRRLADAIAGVGLVVTIDLGDAKDVHPSDKEPVAERLATWALVREYGRAGPATGPRPVRIEGLGESTVRIFFGETGGGLETADSLSPRHLEVAGADRVFQVAAAAIDGDTLVVSAEGAGPPAGIRHVRYAWLPFPRPPVNLVGGTGLPATPFEMPNLTNASR